jgi:Flp pilus assembly protein TadG
MKTTRNPSAGFAARRNRKSNGQTLVEFALVFPIFMLLVMALFDLGRAVYAFNTIANAARDGARVAAVNQIETSPDCHPDRPVEDPANPHLSIKTCVQQAAINLGITPVDVDVTYSAPPGSSLTCTSASLQVGCIARVTVRYEYVPITPGIAVFFPEPIQLQSSSEMLVERVFP